MTTIWASYGFALADSAEPLLKYTWGIGIITTQKDGEKDIYTTQKDGEKNQKVISIKSYLTVIYRVIKWIPVMLLQKKQQEEEERHSRLCTSTISCPLLLDPVKSFTLVIYLWLHFLGQQRAQDWYNNQSVDVIWCINWKDRLRVDISWGKGGPAIWVLRFLSGWFLGNWVPIKLHTMFPPSQ